MHMPPRILIIEDQPTLAKNLKLYLGRLAADVRVAADGEQALALLDSFTPDAIVMDYGLPGMDGLTLYGELVRRAGRPIECIMTTGNSDLYLAQSIYSSGIRRIVCKPYSFLELTKLLQQCLSAADTSRLASLAVASNEVA